MVACSALLAAAILFGWTATASAEAIGTIKTVSGMASVVTQRGAANAFVGQRIGAGDRIETQSDAAVGFILDDGSRFSIGPNSAIVVTDFKFQPQRSLLSLIAELIYGVMAHTTGEIGRMKPDAVQIKTANGVVGVRGTRFAIKELGAEATQ